MVDLLRQAAVRSSKLTVQLAMTTSVCRDAQSKHELESTSAIALGRMLTATALVAHTRPGISMVSLQAMCHGKLGQVFADVINGGELRGYVKNPHMGIPTLPDEKRSGRRSIAMGVGGGILSVIRAGDDREFTQGSTEIRTGEIDADVQHFLRESDQVPTILVCDVLLDDEESIAVAGGVCIQAMPDAPPGALDHAMEAFAPEQFAQLLWDTKSRGGDGTRLLQEVLACEEVASPVPLVLKCRCSYARVLGALSMLGPADLADMVDKGEKPAVNCEFCGAEYIVSADDVEKVFLDTITARG